MSNYLGSNLRYLRKSKAVTQSEVASILGKGSTTIVNWEKGYSKPNIIELNKLATYFGVPINDLMNSNLASDANDEQHNDVNKHNVSEYTAFYGKVSTKKPLQQNDKESKDAVIQAQQITIETLQKALALAEEQISLLKNSPF